MINSEVVAVTTEADEPASSKYLDRWLARAMLSPSEVDCITAVMLKIIDGKCKMPAAEKVIMAALYECAKSLTGQHLGQTYHLLIARAKARDDQELLAEVYTSRVLAETQISRPVMKKFKARLRAEGVLAIKTTGDSNDA